MITGFRDKLKQNKAFTLMETLLVVTMVVIISGVSIFGVSKVLESLGGMELDNYAKRIFVEAQNQLTAKKMEGSLLKYADTVGSAHSLPNKPSDYNENDEDWKAYCYLDKNNTLLKEVIPVTSDIYADEGTYVVEFNPKTGDVYGVFYAKDAAFSYGTINTELESGKDLRADKEARADMKIGYYGGVIPSGDVVTASGAKFTQKVDLINAEELYLQVVIPFKGEVLSSSNLDIKYSIISGETELKKDKLTDVIYDSQADGFKVYVLLDSLAEGYDFSTFMTSEITEGKITPGADLKIVVTTTFKDSDGVIHVEQDTVTGNSLFGNATKDDVIEVSTLRHLMNLGVYEGDLNGKTIKITDNIDFKNKGFSWSYSNGQKPNFDGVGNGQCPVTTFAPINNQNSFRGATIDGNNKTIMNMVLNGTSNNVGLFAKTENTTIQNLYLEDVSINGGSFSNVGSLVGNMVGGEIINCGVHLSTYETDANGNTTSYIDKEDNECSTEKHANYMDHKYDTMSITGGANVGGLVGCVDANAEITGSYAAIQVRASGVNAGGLVGTAANSKIENSYATGTVTAGSYAGGFIGSSAVTDVLNSYAVGDVDAQYAGGFAGSAAGSYRNCISYGLVTGNNAGGFVGDASGIITTSCMYLEQNGYNIGVNDSGIAAPAKYVDLLADTPISASNVYTYNEELVKKDFPFKNITGHTTYYGNWPTENKMETYLLYYERYETRGEGQSEYGYYGVITMEDYENKWIVNTLRTDGSVVVEDGYGLLSKYKNLGNISFSLSNGNSMIGSVEVDTQGGEKVSLTFDAFQTYDTVTGTAEGSINDEMKLSNVYFYKLPYSMQCPSFVNVKSFYNKLVVSAELKGISNVNVIDDTTFYFNPYFAKSAVNDKEAPENTPTAISIRSARQFNALGNQSYMWKKAVNNTVVTYTQECNIDFGKYALAYCGETLSWNNDSIGSNEQPFENVYDAGYGASDSYSIVNYNSSTTMFGVNNGTIKNVAITNANTNDSNKIAGFVKKNNDTIDNVLISNVTSTAGLIGTNNKQIKNVRVSNCKVTSDSDVALFVYNNANGSEIADVSILGTTSVESSGDAYGFVGTNAGNITNVAFNKGEEGSTIKVDGATGGAGFVGTNMETGTIQNVEIVDCEVTSDSDVALFANTNNNVIDNVTILGTTSVVSTKKAYGFVRTNGGAITNVDFNKDEEGATINVNGATGGAGFVGTNIEGGTIGSTNKAITISKLTSNVSLISNNFGDIKNVNVESCVIDGTSNVALFVDYNGSDITDVSISGTTSVVSTKNAYGFVGTNDGSITNVAFNEDEEGSTIKVNGTTGGAGFVGTNTENGKIGSTDKAIIISNLTSNVSLIDMNVGAIKNVDVKNCKIDTTLDYVALFAKANNNVIDDVTVTGTTSVESSKKAYGFVKDNGGTITNVSITGTAQNAIIVNGATGGAGFVGSNTGTIGSAGEATTISNLTSNVSLIDTNGGEIRNVDVESCKIDATSKVALFVSNNSEDGVIDDVTVTGTTSVKSSGSAAYGFVGTNAGTITKVSIIGTAENVITVNGDANGAGFVGSNTGTIGSDDEAITISNLTSNVSLISKNDGEIRNVDIENCKIAGAISDVALFVYDNTKDSVIDDVTVKGTTSVESIKNAYGFVAENAGAITNVSLTGTAENAITVKGKTGGAGFVGTNDVTGTIGNADKDISISNLETNVALITTNDGTIQKVKVTDCEVTSDSDVALFANTNTNEIDDVTIAGTVTATDSKNAYGFAVSNTGSINNVSLNATIKGANAYGFAFSNAGTITDVSLTGTVTGTTGGAGFVGTNAATGTIGNASATTTDITITNLTSNVSLVASNDGTIQKVKVTDCKVTSALDVALFANTNNNVIDNVTITGTTVTATNNKNAYGFAVSNTGSINNVSLNATIKGAMNAYGFVAGNTTTGTITDVELTGTVEGEANVYGFASSNAGTIENVSITGTVTGKAGGAGFVETNTATGIIGNSEADTTDITISNLETNVALITTNEGTIQKVNVSEVNTTSSALFVRSNKGVVDTITIANSNFAGTNNTSGLIYENVSVAEKEDETGIIDNLTITGTKANAPVIHTNHGTIKRATVTGYVVTNVSDMGLFVHTNNGVIGNKIVSDGDDQTGSEETYGVEITNSSITGTGDIAGFVYNNVGTISNCGVYGTVNYSDISITGDRAYGFAYTNTNTIVASYVTGTVTANSGSAAGFVGNNIGNITVAYANTNLTAPKTGSGIAAGFVLTQRDGAIQGSYAVGSVDAYYACGFVDAVDGGQISNCYTVASVDLGDNKYGFARSAVDQNLIANSYWCYDNEANNNNGHNKDVTDGANVAKSLLYVKANASSVVPTDPFTLSGNYPYQSFGLTHYGDWPIAVQQQDYVPGADDKPADNDKLENGVAGDLAQEDNNNILFGTTYEYRGLFYYEIYANGDYGVYAVGLRDSVTTILGGIFGRWETLDTEPNVIINTLRNENPTTRGYGVLYNDTISISENESGDPMSEYNSGSLFNRPPKISDLVPAINNDHYYQFIGNTVQAPETSYVRYIFNDTTPIKVEITASEISEARPKATQQQ